jgi:AraC-like DNA-binding protein
VSASPHIDVTSLVLFFGACQAAFFIALLAFNKHHTRKINFHLATLLLAIGSEVAHQFLLQSGYIHRVPFLIGFALPLDALVGVSLYWYVRIITHPERDHSWRRIAAHYGVFILCVILSIPYWMLGFDQKLLLMETGVVPPQWPPLAYYFTILQTPIKIVSFSAYLVLSMHLLVLHRRRISAIFSYRHRITLNWLNLLLALFIFGLVNGLGVLIFFQEYADGTQIMGFMGIFSMLAILYLGTMGLMQPVIYPPREESFLVEKQEPDAAPARDKYQKSSLAREDMQRIAAKLTDKLEREKLFLDAGLSMPELADSIGVSPNYVSQTINSVFESSFFDLINRLRVDYAMDLLSDPGMRHLSVVDVAAEAAFNSRSTFYNAFKQSTGQTPAQYRKTALSDSGSTA